MGDENHIRTLGDYSKPSHEGYRNTIELPVGNNMDCKTSQRYPDVPTTSWRISLRSMDSFQGFTLKSGRLRKLRPDEAWATIERVSILWHVTYGLVEVQAMLEEEAKAYSEMITNEMYRPPSEPSRQEEFEHIVMNFILDQEERVNQLEEYMRVIINDFMQLSSEVTRRLKDKI
uniref:Uncharacterized protein n=1 Tax=Tanacetum cinerariifolium TaxID=118510 RepID=A0A699GJK1_TANCI|nr:hypothetical protein [Tanacetum cinerariifolium]